jgi:hypothetical protein
VQTEKMPKIKTNRTKAPPEGFEEIEAARLVHSPFALFANQHYSRVFRFWRTTTAKCGMPVSNKREGVFMPVLTS